MYAALAEVRRPALRATAVRLCVATAGRLMPPRSAVGRSDGRAARAGRDGAVAKGEVPTSRRSLPRVEGYGRLTGSRSELGGVRLKTFHVKRGAPWRWRAATNGTGPQRSAPPGASTRMRRFSAQLGQRWTARLARERLGVARAYACVGGTPRVRSSLGFGLVPIARPARIEARSSFESREVASTASARRRAFHVFRRPRSGALGSIRRPAGVDVARARVYASKDLGPRVLGGGALWVGRADR